MLLISELILSSGSTLLVVFLFKAVAFIWKQYTSPKRSMPGPKSIHWLYGNYNNLEGADNSMIDEKWIEEFGHTFKYHCLFNVTKICTLDTRALNHILMHDHLYEKPEHVRYLLSRILGQGVLFVEGDQHKQQRRIMNPAFGPVQIRALTDIFTDKAIQLRDLWSAEITKAKSGTTAKHVTESGHAQVEVLSWLSKATLDIIGLAGFKYEFNALNNSGKTNELSAAFATMFHAIQQQTLLSFLQVWLPPLRLIPSSRNRKITIAQTTMSRIGHALLDDAHASVNAAPSHDPTDSGFAGRDLLSLLVKANTAHDLPEDHKMTDKDVLAQVPTFLVAGHETTSTATAWALYALTQAPAVQRTLRDELLAVSTPDPDAPSMDDLNQLPYLDMFVREVLRLHSPIPRTTRVATADDEIPCDKVWVDSEGRQRKSIKVTKGDLIYIPIRALNRSKEIWGEDAEAFRPERWAKIPETANHVPGIWGHQLSFLAGPRACIGYRFSLVEMKALIYTLVRAFEFELAVPSADIVSRQTAVQRPFVRTEMAKGMQLPLMVRAYRV